jgi:hypothetical protein
MRSPDGLFQFYFSCFWLWVGYAGFQFMRRLFRVLQKGSKLLFASSLIWWQCLLQLRYFVFQGMAKNGDITTLGRGGSDTTAVALAASLKADLCEIYTDVDGVYTADPRIIPQALKLNCISYDEMLELASLGALVLQPRAVEFAKNYAVPLLIRSSFNECEGTLVGEVAEVENCRPVSGVAHMI